MKQQKTTSTKLRGTFFVAAVLFSLICIVVGLLCFQYYDRLQKTVKAESQGYLKEISTQIGVNVSNTIDNNFAVLGSISTVLKSSGAESYEALQPVIRAQRDYWRYGNLMLVDEDGLAYDVSGKRVQMGDAEYLRQVVLEKKRAMSPSQIIDGKECIVFAIPLEQLVLGETKMCALAATYDLRSFDQVLSMSAFDGQGYGHIVNRDGSVVVRSSSASAAKVGYNVLNTLSLESPANESTAAQVRANMAVGMGGQAEFRLEDQPVYMVYTPLADREWYLLTFVPVAAVNAKTQLLLGITLLLCAFLTLIFALLLGGLMLSFYHHKRRLEQIAYVDPVTGGNTIQRFYELMQSSLNVPARPQYALVYLNIAKFKVLNERLGHASCDLILRAIDHSIREALLADECIGRLSSDRFCVLVRYVDAETLAVRFSDWYRAGSAYFEACGGAHYPLLMEFGIFPITDATLPLPQMVDRAKLALKGNSQELLGQLRYAVYDDAVRHQLFREQHLEALMESALLSGEFHVYFQPKYRTQHETIGGAEALVRWQSSEEGMIYPDEFIPLFEKNGFVVRLDLWVFEAVCRAQRRWLDAGYVPITVSVNCSRVQLRNPDFLASYRSIAARYHVPPALLEIELTESVVFENVARLTEIIGEIHAAGFRCAMDDFGSGYSSLNLIRDIPVDVLKLDRIFFRASAQDPARTASVVGSILALARALSMETVAEGVEERAQVDMLRGLGCDYIQGYYFARPMPLADFERLAFGIASKEEIK